MSGRINNKREKPVMISGEIGKLPPQAIDLENAVLGAIIMEDEAYHEVADLLLPEAFYKEQNQIICEAVMRLKNNGEVADLLTVTEEVKRMGKLQLVGGAYYISQLSNRIGGSMNIQVHMRIVLEKFLKRNIIQSSSSQITNSYDETTDAFEILDQWEKDLMTFTSQLFVTKTEGPEELMKQLLEDNERLKSTEGHLTGITTGFIEINKLIGGWQPTDLMILAARPGMGKTALALRFVCAAVKAGKPTAVFSLEQSSRQLFKRIASQESEIPLEMISRTGMDASTVQLLKRDLKPIMKGPIYIDDSAALTLSELRRRCRKLKREKKIEFVVIDYLQLMGEEGKSGNREQEVSKISRGVKALAKELEIPILALSQLSRATEDRSKAADNIPKLSHLRDSGSIEQDADMVMFIYRPEYYGITHTADGESTKGRAQIIFAKNRHGALDTVELKWKGECVLFADPNQALLGSLPVPQNDNFLNERTEF